MANDKNKKKSKAAASSAPVSSAEKTKRTVIIFISVIVGIAIILGAVLGIIAAVRNAGYLMRLESFGIDEGVAVYLSSYFKAVYMTNLASSGIDPSADDTAFWNTEVYNGNTYGDYLAYETEQYLKQVIAANVLFDSYTSLTAEDKNEIELAIKEILVYRAGGSKDEFNELTAEYGFDYDDFRKGTEILYKTYVVKSRIFGSSGENMASFSDYVDEYYRGNYTKVKLIFIRTQNTFVLDDDGNRVTDGNSNDTLRDLTEEEVAERLEYIARLDECMNGINDGSVDVSQFDALATEIYEKYKENISAAKDGYYFNSQSEFTTEFSESFSDVVNASYSMDAGECTVVEYGSVMSETASDESGDSEIPFVGRCYILKEAKEDGAYTGSDSLGFFDDLYSLSATSLYAKMIEEYAALVEVKEKWENIIPALIPYNTDYVARF